MHLVSVGPRAAPHVGERSKASFPFAAAAALAVAASLVGCDVGDAQYQATDTPNVHVADALATLAVKADGSPEDPQRIAADGSTKIVPSASIRIRFDRYLLPGSVTRQAFCLQADPADVADITGCSKPVFIEPSYDPVRREIVLRQRLGTRLALGTLYKLTFYKSELEGVCPDTPRSCGVRAFDGAPLEAVYSIMFRTVDADPVGALDETAPPVVFCGDKGAATALGATCSYASCHGPSTGSSCVPTSSNKHPGCAEGLSFYNLQFGEFSDIEQTAINRVAHQTQMGEAASTPEKTPARFGRAMPLIDAFNPGVTGHPGNSYVMYKILVGMSIDAAPADIKPSDAEVQRLLDSVVVGLPMPPPDPATGPLDAEQLLNLSNWIQHGAPLSTCP